MQNEKIIEKKNEIPSNFNNSNSMQSENIVINNIPNSQNIYNSTSSKNFNNNLNQGIFLIKLILNKY